MLIVLLIGIFLSAGSGSIPGQNFIDSLNSHLKKNMAASDQKKEILTLVDDMENELKDFSKKLKSSGKIIEELNRDHAANREDFEKVLDELNASRAMTQQNILEIRFKIKERMTREKWEEIFSSSQRERE